MMVATIRKPEAEAIRRTGRTQWPKVTAMNGQPVVLGEQTQTPFVVGIQKNRAGREGH